MPDTRPYTHPWQVVRVHTDSYYPAGAYQAMCSHRTRRTANLCAFIRDAATITWQRFQPRWYAEVRPTPGHPS